MEKDLEAIGPGRPKIIDLRADSGGNLNAVGKAAGLFLFPRGKTYSLKTNRGTKVFLAGRKPLESNSGLKGKPPPTAQSINTRLWRFAFNHWPCYRRGGGRVVYIAADWLELRVRLPLTLRTRNYVGTIYGGSMFSAVDPFFMMMLLKTLGKGYIVWDKSGSIRFKRPGRSTLLARLKIDPGEVEEIRAELEHNKSVDRTYSVELKDRDGLVHAIVEKTIFITRKKPGGSGGG